MAGDLWLVIRGWCGEFPAPLEHKRKRSGCPRVGQFLMNGNRALVRAPLVPTPCHFHGAQHRLRLIQRLLEFGGGI
jgi:hypothetical protein